MNRANPLLALGVAATFVLPHSGQAQTRPRAEPSSATKSVQFSDIKPMDVSTHRFATQVEIEGKRHGVNVRVGVAKVPNATDVMVIYPGKGEPLEAYKLKVYGKHGIAQRLNEQGINVIVLEPPGQGDLGRYGNHPHMVDIPHYRVYTDTLKQFMESDLYAKLAEGKPAHLLGHSMGGQNVRLALLLYPELQKRFHTVHLLAHMAAIVGGDGFVGGAIHKTAKAIQTARKALGAEDGFAPGQANQDPKAVSFAKNQWTNDPLQYEARLAAITPATHTGGVGWRWLTQQLESIRLANQLLDQGTRIAPPVIVHVPLGDTVIAPDSQIKSATKMGAAIVRYPCEQHELHIGPPDTVDALATQIAHNVRTRSAGLLPPAEVHRPKDRCPPLGGFVR